MIWSIEKAKACETTEERMAFLEEYNIEVPDDMLDEVSGGKKYGRLVEDKKNTNTCPNANGMNHGFHKWEKTGRKRPGDYFGNVWKDEEYRCAYCGALKWCW